METWKLLSEILDIRKKQKNLQATYLTYFFSHRNPYVAMRQMHVLKMFPQTFVSKQCSSVTLEAVCESKTCLYLVPQFFSFCFLKSFVCTLFSYKQEMWWRRLLEFWSETSKLLNVCVMWEENPTIFHTLAFEFLSIPESNLKINNEIKVWIGLGLFSNLSGENPGISSQVSSYGNKTKHTKLGRKQWEAPRCHCWLCFPCSVT